MTGWRAVTRFGGVAALAILLTAAIASGWWRHLAPADLRAHYGEITDAVQRDPILALGVFILVSAAVTAACLPGIGVLIVLSGALFGAWLGGAASLLGIVIGSTCVFLACRAAAADWARPEPRGRLARLTAAFSGNAFSSLLVLRLTPVAPLSLVNIAAGLARVRLAPFLAASLIGSAPSNLIYAGLGAGLRSALQRGLTLDPSMLTSPRLIWPLAALAALASAAVFANLRRRR